MSASGPSCAWWPEALRRALGALGLVLLLQGCERAPAPAEAPSPPAQAQPGQPALPLPPQAPSLPRPPAAVEAPFTEPGDLEGARMLATRDLVVPVAGVPPEALADGWHERRGGRLHQAIDIVAPRGTPVVAADDGRIVKLFNSKPGGITVYQFDPTGRLAYYYAHLERYAPGLREGMEVRRGQVIGYVGSSGNAEANIPHLHFAVFRLGPEANWWEGEPVNPYPALARAEAVQAR